MITVILMLCTLPILLAVSAFFSGSETALFSLSAQQRATLAQSRHLVDIATTTLLAQTRSLLITLLMGNMTVNVLYFAICSALLIQLDEKNLVAGPWMVPCAVVPLVAIILLGEVIPKLIAARTPQRWSKATSMPMLLFHRLIAPLRILSSVLIITPLARLSTPPTAPPTLSADELEQLLSLSQDRGVIDADEQRLLQQVLELSDMKVRDLMVPRVDIEAFNLESSADLLMPWVRRTRRRHLPIYRGDLDHIEGILSRRALLLDSPATTDQIQAQMQPPLFVPEQQHADQLLDLLRRRKAAMAIVVDEYGGTAGLITARDVAEHVVGELAGDYDDEANHETEVVALGPGAWRVSADLSVRDWPALFGRRSDKLSVDVRTVGGLVMALLGRLPHAGESVKFGALLLTVNEMAGRRIRTVTLTLNSSQEEKR